MQEHQPINIRDFYSSVELERSEPKNRFNSGSLDYDPVLDTVLDQFPVIKTWYKIGYKEYVAQQELGFSYNGDYANEIAYPVLLCSKVINEINVLRTPEGDLPYICNLHILNRIVDAAISTSHVDETTEIIKAVLKEMKLSEYELKGMFIAKNLLQEAAYYEGLGAEDDLQTASFIKKQAFKELQKLRPAPIVKE